MNKGFKQLSWAELPGEISAEFDIFLIEKGLCPSMYNVRTSSHGTHTRPYSDLLIVGEHERCQKMRLANKSFWHDTRCQCIYYSAVNSCWRFFFGEL